MLGEFAASYVIIAIHRLFLFQYNQPLYIYHRILVFLHSSIDLWRELGENIPFKKALFKATQYPFLKKWK